MVGDALAMLRGVCAAAWAAHDAESMLGSLHAACAEVWLVPAITAWGQSVSQTAEQSTRLYLLRVHRQASWTSIYALHVHGCCACRRCYSGE